jgi:hypothetical protein
MLQKALAICTKQIEYVQYTEIEYLLIIYVMNKRESAH